MNDWRFPQFINLHITNIKITIIMKKTLFTFAFALFIFFANTVQAQVEVKLEEFPTYQGVVTVDGKTKDEIYAKVKAWLATSLNSANSAVQLDDKENGKIITNLSFKSGFSYMGIYATETIKTKLTIDLQDNRFRYTYLVVDVVNGGGNSDMNIMLNKPKQKGVSVIKEDVKSKINIDVKNLYETIIDSKSDTW